MASPVCEALQYIYVYIYIHYIYAKATGAETPVLRDVRLEPRYVAVMIHPGLCWMHAVLSCVDIRFHTHGLFQAQDVSLLCFSAVPLPSCCFPCSCQRLRCLFVAELPSGRISSSW